MRGWGIFALLALMAGAALAAPPPPPPASAVHLDVAVAPGKATVGDHVEVVLTLRAPAAELAGEPRFPVWGQEWGEAEVTEKEEPARISEAGGTVVWRQRIALTAWHPGKVSLPPVAVAVPLKSATVQAASPANLALAVSPTLPPTKQGEKDPPRKPDAPPRLLPWGAPFGWSTLALSLACLGVAYLLWRRERQTETAAAPVPALAPFEELLAGLDRLAGEGSAVVLHTRLSLALRSYLGRTLAFPAAESTTSEIQRRLILRQLPSALVRRTIELLRACDLVKFARQEVGDTVSRERLGAVRELGRDFESYLAPPPGIEEPLEKAG